jgi:hypothetical protein
MLRKTAFVNTILFALLVLSSCHSARIVEREVIKHDSIYITAVSVDTLIQRDSVHTIEKGDTILKTVYKYIYKVRERTDTCFVQHTDTVTMTETKVETKTVKKKDWLSIIGAMCIGILTGIITLPIISFFAGGGRTQSVSSLPPPNKR